MRTIECFFDCSSPWTYLGFESLEQLRERVPAEVRYRPFLVGGVFNTVNPSVYENRQNPVPAKARYAQKDLQDWARYVGIEIGSPAVFPVNSVKVMRGAFFAEEAGLLVPYARAAFHAYWTRLKDISEEQVIREILAEVGLDADTFFNAIQTTNYKERLKANTTELVERGGFGSPTFFIDGQDMYFGNDRFPLIEAALAARS